VTVPESKVSEQALEKRDEAVADNTENQIENEQLSQPNDEEEQGALDHEQVILESPSIKNSSEKSK